MRMRCARSSERFDTSLGTGLIQGKGKMFRIGHLGECNDVSLMGTLCAVEMGLSVAGVVLKGKRRCRRDVRNCRNDTVGVACRAPLLAKPDGRGRPLLQLTDSLKKDAS